MILKVTAYGDPLLRRQSVDIDENYPELESLISNMYETMYSASGMGLAAPQVGLNINLFIIDTTPVKENKYPLKKVFINPEIIEMKGKAYPYEEGCLSIPKIREDVVRKSEVLLNYLDENFDEHEELFDDINARVIMHEYDHLNGVLFIDKISSIKKRLLRKKLNDISQGNIDVDYPMRFPLLKKKKAI